MTPDSSSNNLLTLPDELRQRGMVEEGSPLQTPLCRRQGFCVPGWDRQPQRPLLYKSTADDSRNWEKHKSGLSVRGSGVGSHLAVAEPFAALAVQGSGKSRHLTPQMTPKRVSNRSPCPSQWACWSVARWLGSASGQPQVLSQPWRERLCLQDNRH